MRNFLLKITMSREVLGIVLGCSFIAFVVHLFVYIARTS